MGHLSRRLTLGHAILAVVATVLIVGAAAFAAIVLQVDSTVAGCMDANDNWLATARKDIRDAAGEDVLASDANATPLEREQHAARADEAFHATVAILDRISIPAESITYDAHGTPSFTNPPRSARLQYCRQRYPRPWPL